MAPYTITIECKYSEFWRYNLTVTGAVMAEGSRKEWISYSDEVAQVGANLAERPSSYKRPESIVITTDAGDALTLYIYILPHSLPIARVVSECVPFELHVTINHGDDVVYNRRLEVNQWSGDNIEIKVKGGK